MAVFDELRRYVPDMDADLVDGRHHATVFHYVVQILDFEVRNPDGAETSGGVGFFQGFPDFQVLFKVVLPLERTVHLAPGSWRMDEHQVHVAAVQPHERFQDILLGFLVRLDLRGNLGGDEDAVAVNACGGKACPDAFPDTLLVLVGDGGVDMPEAGVDGRGDCGLGRSVGGLPGPESNLWYPLAVVQFVEFVENHVHLPWSVGCAGQKRTHLFYYKQKKCKKHNA